MQGVLFGGLLALVCLSTINAQVFSVATTQTYAGDSLILEPVPFDRVFTNAGDDYDPETHTFICEDPGAYYFTFSAGTLPEQGAHLVMSRSGILGAEVRNTDTFADGVGVSSRGILNNLQQGVRMQMAARIDEETSLQGDPFSHLTTWSGFRYNDLADTVIAFSVARTTNLSQSQTPVQFDTEILNIGVGANTPLNMSSGIFRAQSTGIYFFHISAGSRMEREVRVNITRNYPSEYMASLYRTIRNSNGVDTISRSLMMELEFGDTVQVSNDFGSELYSDAGYQVSFSGFLYTVSWNPGPTNVAFYVYRSTSWDGPITAAPFDFDMTVLNTGIGYNETTDIFSPNAPGYYMFSISVGVQPGTSVGVSLRQNSQVMMRLERRTSAHNGIDTFSRDIVLDLAGGDVMHVEADGGTATYSDNGAQTSWLGFRLRNLD